MFVSGVVSLAAGCRYLQVVYLRRCVNVGDDGVIALARNCHQLRDLNIGGCTLVSDASLRELAEHSSLLSSIDFSRANVCYKSTVCSCSIKVKLKSTMLH